MRGTGLMAERAFEKKPLSPAPAGAKGMTETFTCKVDEVTARKVDELLTIFRSNNLPLRTRSDFIRHCLEVGVDWFTEELDQDLGNGWLHNQMVEDGLVRELEDQLDLGRRVEVMIDRLKSVIRSNNSIGHYERSAHAVEVFWGAYHKITDPIWRSAVAQKYRTDGDLALLLKTIQQLGHINVEFQEEQEGEG